LRKIRDEAHRFAITYHRNKRDKDITKSILDITPGIGEKRKNILLKELENRAGHPSKRIASFFRFS